jgi:hypothetical protein
MPFLSRDNAPFSPLIFRDMYVKQRRGELPPVFTVAMLREDDSICAVAYPKNLIEATEEAKIMSSCGHVTVLRSNGAQINRWLGTCWERQLPA